MTFRADFYQGVSYRWMYGFKSLFMVLVVISIWGCGGPVIKFGRMPDTTRLEASLRPEISTRDDVFVILGEPRNGGGAMLPLHNSPRDMWVYYYEEGTMTDDRRIFLFVFFKEDLYDGYLWFSSLHGTNPESFQ
jgi:hypothetical protein